VTVLSKIQKQTKNIHFLKTFLKACEKKGYNMEQMERNLMEQVAQLDSRKEFLAWEQRFHQIARRTKQH